MTRARVLKTPKIHNNKKKRFICLIRECLVLFLFFTGTNVFLKNNSEKFVSILHGFFRAFYM